MRLMAFVLAMSLLPGIASAQADISAEQLQELLRVKIRTVQHMALNPTVIRATRRQNDERLALEEIKKRDEAWKSTKELTPFKRRLQHNEAGRFLKTQVSRNESFNEAFLTDNQGANVAAFPATSDYWQGDEEKWSESYRNGDGVVYLGELELDESTNTYAVQISAPVYHLGRTIGVLVVGVTLDYLETRGIGQGG